MNRLYNTIWNEARGTYVVAHEKSKSKGKPSSTRKGVVSAVAAALLSMAASAVMAGPSQPWNSGNPTIINASSAGITGTNGITASGSFTGSITNSGTIIGTSSNGIQIISSTILGGITNNVSGTISGNANGILAADSSISSIANSGAIIGTTSNGMTLTNSTVSGSITNNAGGRISGGNIGIYANNDSIGNIANSGAIIGLTSVGIDLSGSTVSGSITNNAGGTIYGGYTGIRADSSSIGGITNSGAIIGVNSDGIYLSGSTVSGSITNNAGGTISGGSKGIYASNASIGSITNSGAIIGVNSDGIYLSGSTVSGGITNNAGGTISGNVGIIAAYNSSIGNITNSGAISGYFGILAVGNASIGNITNSGTISGIFGIAAANNVSIGNITNSGAISGGYFGIYAASNVSIGNITNSGNISGGYFGILAANNVSIGNITNSGNISSDYYGIYLSGSTVSGGITNNAGGTISGGSYGIYASSSASIGGITNNAGGTISGGSKGIYAVNSSSIGGITNSGTISGGTYAVYVDSSSTLGSINITGTNTAKFIGDVYAQNTPVNITSGSTFTGTNAFEVQSFNIAAGALFNMTTMPSTSGTASGGIIANGVTTTQGVNNAGTLAIAAGDIGTITGNFTNTGKFSPAVASMSSYGQLTVSGTATLGGTLAVNVIGTPSLIIGGTLAGVITAGTISGAFASVTDNSQLFDFVNVQNGNAIDLTIKSGITAVKSVTATGNTASLGAATVIDQLIAAGGAAPVAMAPVVTALGKLSTAQQVSNAISQTLPLLAGGQNLALGNVLHDFNRIVQARQESEKGSSSGDSFLVDKHFWFKPFGSWADQNNSHGASGYIANTYGMIFGADAETSENNRFGLALAYAHTDLDGTLSSAPQNSRINSYQLIGYGSHSLNENTDLSFQADFGKNDTDGSRSILFMNSVAKASYSGWNGHLGAALARSYNIGEGFGFTPSIRVDYTAIRSDAYHETGAGALNLNVGSNTTDQLILGVDGKLTHSLTEKTKLTANLGAGYDVINDSASITSAYAGNPTAAFVTNGINPDPWLVRGGLGLVGNMQNGVELSARYDFEVRNGFDNKTASVKVRWAF